jgi:small conductance mechanosensitive channel
MNLETMLKDYLWMDISQISDIVVTWVIWYIPKIIWALLVIWIWFKVVKILDTAINKVMDRQDLSPMLKTFISSLTWILLKILVFVAAAWILWVQTSSFVAMIAAAWFAIGMALSWTLQNFAWWIMILILKPFVTWNYVEVWWVSWSVKSISIFNTTLLTPDRKIVVIPNSDISNWTITNYTAEPTRRLELKIWVSYTDDIDLVKETLLNLAENQLNVLKDEDITIWLNEFGDNSVNFNFFFYVNTSEYWSTKYDMMEKIKKTFDEKGISIPFPQRDVHIYNEKS